MSRRYQDLWNGRDADALVAAFTKDGIFCNPDTYPGISGEALAEFVKKVWRAFPDFRIELLNAGEIEPGWSPTTGKLPALTPARGWMAARLLDVPLLLRELPSLRLREIKSYQITAILTDSR